MMAQRTAAPPQPSYSPRAAADSAARPQLDAVLKQLKSCTRRLRAALESHRTELRVLERLYYKGKNQHRTALFWRRVVEMRRYGGRLEGMNVHTLVEDLRLAFWGDPSMRSSKALKGPWTHTPDTASLLFVLRRCSECKTLVSKTRERLQETYRSFTLMMQSGAFIQLILTLAAIASRLSILLAEVLSALEVCARACSQALQALDTRSAQPFSKGAIQGAQIGLNSAVGEVTAIQRHKGLGEDLGLTVQRPPASRTDGLPPSLHVEDNFSSGAVQTVEGDALGEPSASVATTSIVTRERMSVKRTTTAAVISRVKATSASTREGKRKGPGADAKQQPKEKKKRDEIDDIFGF
ncbi:hypothetical protein B0H21DRAFT_278183 [Amylocystis lapponica]|nr:hypothetical protein B0H21DRAFT_278183 [Amylocystis lapponica]